MAQAGIDPSHLDMKRCALTITPRERLLETLTFLLYLILFLRVRTNLKVLMAQPGSDRCHLVICRLFQRKNGQFFVRETMAIFLPKRTVNPLTQKGRSIFEQKNGQVFD